MRRYKMIISNVQPELAITLALSTNREKDLISKVFQNYYCMGISEIADEDETVKSLFKKVGLI